MLTRIRFRSLVLMLCDLFIFLVSYAFSMLVCNIEFFTLGNILVPCGIYASVLYFSGVYNSLWRYAQSMEFFKCIVASFIAGGMFYILDRLFAIRNAYGYFYALVICLTSLGMVSFRLGYRVYRGIDISHKSTNNKQRALIVGAGSACLMLINDLRINVDALYTPVLIVDDDNRKHTGKIGGISIAGGVEDIPHLCKEYSIDVIIFAIPSVSNERRSKILTICEKTGCVVKVLPFVAEIRNQANVYDKLRNVQLEELLGRDVVSLDNSVIGDSLCDKIVMITGGGGSIGSELCRQIAVCGPKKLILVDIYENSLYDLQQWLWRKHGSSLDFVTIVASVRDRARMDFLLKQYQPNIIFHAAAHKHVPLMETSPTEAVKNNVFGTWNLTQAALDAGIEKFILISTDKAVNPTNIMGATKRLCEMIVQTMATRGNTVFAAVRFGNVLGSNGSVIPLFKRQIEEGGPVTVTDPEIIRYFMTIPEAAQLVLTAGAMAAGGEIFVLDMGQPVKIADLAEKMIRLAGLKVGRDIDILYTGLRPGEKLFEELLMGEEGMIRTGNDKIFIGSPIAFDMDALEDRLGELAQAVISNDPMVLEAKLMEIVDTFKRA